MPHNQETMQLNELPNTRGVFARIAPTLAAEGWQVFPLAPGTKTPYAGSHGHLDATDDPAVVSRWARETPEANAGVRPPESVVVLDVDDPVTFESWCAARRLATPDTRTVHTRRGVHLYYRLPQPVDLRAQLVGVKVDLKSHRGFVLAPGSVVGGHTYRLSRETPPADLPTLPSQWLPLVTRPQRQASPPSGPQRGLPSGADPTRLARLLSVKRPGDGRRGFLRWALCEAHRTFTGAELQHAVGALVEAAGHVGLDPANTAELAEWANQEFTQETSS